MRGQAYHDLPDDRAGPYARPSIPCPATTRATIARAALAGPRGIGQRGGLWERVGQAGRASLNGVRVGQLGTGNWELGARVSGTSRDACVESLSRRGVVLNTGWNAVHSPSRPTNRSLIEVPGLGIHDQGQ
jgi:hypothetical protein